jgi:tetratricopeptide (TPR) repeat protein
LSDGKRLDPKALEGGMRAAFESDSVHSTARPEPAPGQRGAGETFADDGRHYEVLGEIGRGGLGVVYEGHDQDLDRRVALKVLRPEYEADPAVVAHFVEEARIGAQLEHPGIVPIYGMGLASEGRLYFAMKLVQGETLSALLERRESVGQDLRRFLGIFEQVCQTMAYVHTRGLVHRDLKPANVMVGAYGEVLIVDWGLAKLLGEEEPEEDERKPASRRPASGSATVTGAVRGTLAYMPPEQARGRIHEVDERSDVFALGAMLCEILTGRPPYTGETSDPLFEAAEGQLNAAMERLAACGADDDLVALARHCLAPDPAERPRHAGPVAQAIGDHLAAVEERARRAEIAAAEEHAQAKVERARERQARHQAEWERRGRRRTPVLAAVVLLAVVLGIGGHIVKAREDHARAEQTRAKVVEAMRKAISLESAGQWKVALSWADKAIAHARAGPADGATLDGALALRAHSEEHAAAAAAAARRAEDDDRLLAQLEGIHIHELTPERIDQKTSAAFRGHGIDVEQLSLEEAVARIRSRTKPAELAMALDSWAHLRRTRLEGRAWEPLDQIARAVDPDPWRSRLRDAVTTGDLETLRALADATDIVRLPARALARLARCLHDAGDSSAAEDLLRRALRRRSDGFLVNSGLAGLLAETARPREAVRFCQAALAVDPDGAHVRCRLGQILGASIRDHEGAVREQRAVVARDATVAGHHRNLGEALLDKGDHRAGIDAFRRAIQLDPEDAKAWSHLGWALSKTGDLEGAILAYRKALDLDPNLAGAWSGLGRVLGAKGDVREALAVCRKAVGLDPEDGRVRDDLGTILCDYVRDYDGAIREFQDAIRLNPGGAVVSTANLGNALLGKGDLTAAIEAYRRALDLDPACASAWFGLGCAREKEGSLNAAIEAYRRACKLDRDCVQYWVRLGLALARNGEVQEGLEACRKALQLAPDDFAARHDLGTILCDHERDYDGAIREFKAAIRLNPSSALAYTSLGHAQRGKGDLTAAIGSYQRAMELDRDDAAPWRGLGRTLNLKGEWKRAVAAYRKAIQLDPDSADAHNCLGAILCDHGRDYDGAIRAFQDAIRLNPSSALLHTNLGNALKGKGDLTAAIKAYQRAMELEGDYAAAWHGLGTALKLKGDWRGALVAYRKTVQLDPDSADAHNCLGAILCDRVGDYDGAIRVFREAVRLDQESARYRFNLANALEKKGRFTSALKAYRKAVELDPRFASGWSGVGWLLRRKGDLADAIVASRKAVELEPDNALFRCRLGVALGDQGDDSEAAIRELRTAVELDPNDPRYRYVLGLALYRTGRFDDATGTLEVAVRLSGGRSVLAKRALGRAFYRAGRFKDAIRTLDELMRQARGGDAGDGLFMAMAQAKAGHPEEARSWYRKTVAWLEERPWETEFADLRKEAEAVLDNGGKTR